MGPRESWVETTASALDAGQAPTARRPARAGGRARGTRGRILNAAASLFRERHFDRTAMQDIAAAVGVTKASLYHHLPGKQALLYEIIQHTVGRALPELERIADLPLSATERLRQAVRLHVQILVHDRDNVGCTMEEWRSLHPKYHAAGVAGRDRYETLFRRIIEDGIRSGEFAPTDVQLARLAVLGMCNWMIRWYRPEGRCSAEEIGVQFGEYAIAMLRDIRAPETAVSAAADTPSR